MICRAGDGLLICSETAQSQRIRSDAKRDSSQGSNLPHQIFPRWSSAELLYPARHCDIPLSHGHIQLFGLLLLIRTCEKRTSLPRLHPLNAPTNQSTTVRQSNERPHNPKLLLDSPGL